MIWAPGAEAVRLQQSMDVRSLADTSAAVERAGYRICYVDLPKKVSGLATVIEGQPYIVLNRAKSVAHLQFTVPHELAHHILHLDASRDPGPLGAPSKGTAEFQAHQFAAMWIFLLGTDEERQNVLNQNPESLVIVGLCLLMTAGVILVPLIAHLWSYLRRTNLPEPEPVPGK
jgi:Zn-dependent peptidase ImmA (M78 family)